MLSYPEPEYYETNKLMFYIHKGTKIRKLKIYLVWMWLRIRMDSITSGWWRPYCGCHPLWQSSTGFYDKYCQTGIVYFDVSRGRCMYKMAKNKILCYLTLHVLLFWTNKAAGGWLNFFLKRLQIPRWRRLVRSMEIIQGRVRS